MKVGDVKSVTPNSTRRLKARRWRRQIWAGLTRPSALRHRHAAATELTHLRHIGQTNFRPSRKRASIPLHAQGKGEKNMAQKGSQDA